MFILSMVVLILGLLSVFLLIDYYFIGDIVRKQATQGEFTVAYSLLLIYLGSNNNTTDIGKIYCKTYNPSQGFII